MEGENQELEKKIVIYLLVLFINFQLFTVVPGGETLFMARMLI